MLSFRDSQITFFDLFSFLFSGLKFLRSFLNLQLAPKTRKEKKAWKNGKKDLVQALRQKLFPSSPLHLPVFFGTDLIFSFFHPFISILQFFITIFVNFYLAFLVLFFYFLFFVLWIFFIFFYFFSKKTPTTTSSRNTTNNIKWWLCRCCHARGSPYLPLVWNLRRGSLPPSFFCRTGFFRARFVVTFTLWSGLPGENLTSLPSRRSTYVP